MDCPQCKTDLVMSERQGVEIDHCPNCRGVWLDRGELDKIIERSHAHAAAYGSGSRNGGGGDDDWDVEGGGPHPPRRPTAPHPQQPYPHGYRKKKSFWEELFD